MKRILIVLMLLLPATASGETICGESCADTEPGDTYTMVRQQPINMNAPYDIANGVVRRADGSLLWGSYGCWNVALPGIAQRDCGMGLGFCVIHGTRSGANVRSHQAVSTFTWYRSPLSSEMW